MINYHTPLRLYLVNAFSAIVLCAVSNFCFGKGALSQMQPSRARQVDSIAYFRENRPLTDALTQFVSPKKNYDTANAQEKTIRLRSRFDLRRQPKRDLLRSRWQSHPQAAQSEEANPISSRSNFFAMIPRLIEVTQCTLPGAWYEDLAGTSFTVMDREDDFYIVDEYDWQSNRLIPLMIKISDCKILER